jgi:DME family drug/metabolite transporter
LNDQARGALLIMAAAFLWGTMGVISKITYANTTVGPIALAFFRLLFAIPLLALVSWKRRCKISLTRRETVLFAGFGFFSLTIFETLYFVSLSYTTVQHAAALLYTSPAFVAILSRLILKEKLTKHKIAAVGLSILGAFLILGLVRGEPLFSSRSQIGDWLAVGSGIAYSSWYIFGKTLGSKRDPAVTSLIALSFGTVFLLPILTATEGLRPPQSLLAWQLVALIGIVPTTIAYLLYLAGLKLLDATKASVFAIVEPLTAAIFGFLFLQEVLSYDSLVGFVLIISSILLISTSNR